MTAPVPRPAPGGVGLLERAVGYLLGCLASVTPGRLDRRTPCRYWTLRDLLAHLADSLVALHEAIDTGRVGLAPQPPDPAADPVALLRTRAGELLGAWNAAEGGPPVSVGGRPLAARIVAVIGAVEITVHGWDVAVACGHHRPVPPALAADLLRLAPMVVTDDDRPDRFARPVPTAAAADPAARLLAFLGRDPYRVGPVVVEERRRA